MQITLYELYVMLVSNQFIKVSFLFIGMLVLFILFFLGYQTWIFPWRRLEIKGLLDPLVSKIMHWLPAGCILLAILLDHLVFLNFSIEGVSFKYQIPFSAAVFFCVVSLSFIGVPAVIIYYHIQILVRKKVNSVLYPFWLLCFFLIGFTFILRDVFYQ